MKILSSRNGIAILLILVVIGLFANLMMYWILPAVKAQTPAEPGSVPVTTAH